MKLKYNMTQKILFLLFLLTSLCYASNTSDTNWCSVCKCKSIDNMLTLDCNKQSLEHFPTSWPEEFLKEDHLEDKTLTISINDNQIKKLMPLAEIKCKRIHISLENNGLENIQMASFKNVKNIYYLNLASNNLLGDTVRADVFRGPYNNSFYEPIDLEVLNLGSNQIHSLGRKTFEHTPNLRSLSLYNNPLDVLDSVTVLALSSIKNLEDLDLSYTGIKHLPESIMKNTKSLRKLNLSGNKFTTVPESIGAVAVSLQSLKINNNKIEELNENSFLGLWRLEFLEIGTMDSLKSVKSGTFSQVLSLKRLHLCHNPNLQEINHDAFLELKENWPIQELNLRGNNLESLPEDLVPWNKLVTINLESNPWNCDCKMAMNIAKNGISNKIPPNSPARCMTPLKFSGIRLGELNPETMCTQMELNQNITVHSPYSINSISHRSSGVFVALAFVTAVVVIGLCIGCYVSYIRNKFKKIVDLPVRYTTLHT